MWIFGYGSLLWYTDFPYERVQGGHVEGFQRRFWQLSPDHRGTPEAPGRTVTLIPAPKQACWGLAYKVPEEHQKATLAYLDHREKAGYTCERASFRPDDGSAPFTVHVYISATEDNEFHAGPTEDEEIAKEILIRHGPSGPNVEYALKLALVLRNHSPHSDDDHVYSIERRILELAERTGQGKESLERLGYRLMDGKWTPPHSNEFSLLKRE
ncbi:hypothetical protein PENTCL1PPCAC_437 [Pristionchus entomophagus]|uniref:glutathione-specific gamma-glutamylcyclotransferase n=1 Tax=Pristionchus entomophagus TaxID=358040 RepID=A0AAV5S7I4_9BILA|nr:hypothetical protein PENTCL1PPCAC_437 [Pristionchus entomophagus]